MHKDIEKKLLDYFIKKTNSDKWLTLSPNEIVNNLKDIMADKVDMKSALFNKTVYTLSQSDCHPELPRGEEYHSMSFGAGSLSYEEAMCLYGLIIGCKPTSVLETGCETGASTLHIARALRDQGKGHLHTVEKDIGNCRMTMDLLEKNGLSRYTTIYREDSIKYIKDTKFTYDFAFLDTLIDIRIEEFRTLLPKMRPGGIVVIHDTSPHHPMGHMKIDMELAGMKMVHINSPRRMTVVQV